MTNKTPKEWEVKNYCEFPTKRKRNQTITVTKTFLPKKSVYYKRISKIWSNLRLTNEGSNVIELQNKLESYFNVKHVILTNNGTIALQVAIKSLNLEPGEIITTPFSYVATTSSIVWEGYKPIFVDIDPLSWTLNPNKIEAAITSKTRAIMPVHVYGIPCNVSEIKRIADKHHLKVIYDAAHAYGVNYQGKSLVSYGDLSTLSFHATKLFHTIEGGAIITNNDQIAHQASYMKNFGHETPTSFYGVGINGKMNEFCAAMGLTTIDSIPNLIEKREKVFGWYDQVLNWLNPTKPQLPVKTKYNFSYYPILFSSETQLLAVTKKLEANNIIPRRYFYPSLNTLPYVKYVKCPVSEDISTRILCLPLYPELLKYQIRHIARLIQESIGS